MKVMINKEQLKLIAEHIQKNGKTDAKAVNNKSKNKGKKNK
jgi:hypothetical protein